MKLTGNTILITGGGSGIGRGLAEAFHKLGNKVIVAGRRKQALDDTTSANPGMTSAILNIEDVKSIRALASEMSANYPALNVVIQNAGVMRLENLKAHQDDLGHAESIIATNLLGPIRLNAALLPQLQKQPSATIMTVSSGLAFVPLALTPSYCATKAAIHSFTQSLRYQFKGTPIEVLELIPPYVQTDLLGGAEDPRAMPLAQYIAEVMEILKNVPKSGEICVEKVNALRLAAENGQYDNVFSGLNDAWAKAAH